MKINKKKFNKRYLAFGILGLFVLALASAALVGYLSNTVQAEITVESPMITGISLGEENWADTLCVRADTGAEIFSFPECEVERIHDWAESDWTRTGTLEIPAMKGGESITLYTMSQNVANVEITGYEEAIVTNPSRVTCDDFESVKVYVDSIYGDLGYGSENDALLICVQDGDYKVKFDSEGFGASSTWGAGEADVSKMVVTFKTGATGTYTFSYKVIPA